MKDMLRLSLISFFHPVNALRILKERRDEIKLYPFFILILAAILVRFLSIYLSNFSVVDVSPYEANIFIEAGKIILIIVTWSICSFGLTTIFAGEAKLKETLMGSCLAIVPYIVGTAVLIVFSNIVSSEEIEIFSAVQSIIMVYVVIMLFITLKVLNEMTLLKTIALAIASVVGVLVVWGLVIIFIALIAQLGVFFNEIATEIKYIGGYIK